MSLENKIYDSMFCINAYNSIISLFFYNSLIFYFNKILLHFSEIEKIRIMNKN